MAEFRKMIITTAGKELLSKVIAESATFAFTKAALSAQNYADEEIVALEQLDIHQELPVHKVLRDEDSTVQVTAILDNAEVTTSYQYASIGLYAQTVDEAEVLFAVCGSNVPGYIPSNNSPFAVFLNLRIGFSDNEAVAFQQYLLEQKIGTEIAERILWSSKHMVERLCPPIEISGQTVECHPIAGYPLEICVNKPNVIHYEYALYDNPHVDSGITFTRRSDGSILVDGTATYDAHYFIFSGYGEDNPLLTAGVPVGTTLRLHGAPVGSSESTYELYYYTGMAAVGDIGVTHHDYGDGASFTTLERDYEVTYGWECGIRIRQGVICDHLVFRPHLEMVGDLILNVQTSEGLTSLPLTDSSVFEMPAVEGGMSFEVSGDAAVTVRGREDIIHNIDVLKSKADMAERELSQKVDKASFSTAANALKGNVVGAAVGMPDVSPLEHDLKVKVSSKNILPYPYADTTKTKNGITYTDNGDGSVSIKGTATNYAPFVLSNTNIFTDGVTYSLSSGVIVLYLDRYGERVWAVNKLEWKKEFTFIQIYFQAVTDAVYDTTLYPQIEKGTVATDYTPYVDVKGTPVSQYGKNLLSVIDGEQTLGLYKIAASNGVISKEATSTFSSGTIFSVDVCSNFIGGISTFPSGTYTFSANQFYYSETEKYLDVGLDIKLADGTRDMLVAGTPKTIEQPFTVYSVKLADVVPTMFVGEVYETTLQLEVGNAATDYEPFTELIATATVNADGTVDGLRSHYPSTTLLSDTDGAIIECEYNKDLNKAYDALVQAIISLGGNV